VDRLKLLIAGCLVGGAIGAFYYFSDHSLLTRVIGLLLLLGVATAIAMQTTVGQNVWEFAVSSRMEVRKVVWPTREETTRTTLIVMVMVIFVAMMLWLLDMFLLWAVRLLTGHGG
jgi:preprotein translocase subunit SecE